MDGFVNWTIDLGGEMIHGKGTILDKIVDSQKWEKRQVFYSFPEHPDSKPTRKNIQEHFYLGREGKLVPYNTDDKDVQHLIRTMDRLADEGTQPNTNLLEYLTKQKVAYRVLGLADALWAKVYGSDLDLVGVNDAREEENQMSAEGFEINYRVKGSFKLLVDYLKKPLETKINWIVKSIDSSQKDQIVLKNQLGETVSTKKVIVTVPLTVLKDGDIQFSPPLPISKQGALRRMGMDSGACKVLVKMSQKFWNDNIQLVICGDCFVPELWIEGGPYRGTNAPWLIVGFATGDNGRNIASMDEKEAILHFVAQLNTMFGSQLEPNPATKYFLGGKVFDWGKMPFVRGSYSYPKLNSLGDRTILRKPIEDRIFFAGEAVSDTTETGTINASLITGERAAQEALESTKSSMSKL